MFALKWLLMTAGFAMFGTAAGIVGYDVYLAMQFQKLMGSGEPGVAEKAGPRRPFSWWAPLPASGLLSVEPTLFAGPSPRNYLDARGLRCCWRSASSPCRRGQAEFESARFPACGRERCIRACIWSCRWFST